MPTYRKLHTKILDSYDFAEMPNDFTRVFWMLLIVVVDSEGRAVDHPAWLRSKMFPLREDIKHEAIEAALAWLAERELIVRYAVSGRQYFYVASFKKHQTGTEKEAKSVLPAPEEGQELLKSRSGVDREKVCAAASASVSDSAFESVSASYSDSSDDDEYELDELDELTPKEAERIPEIVVFRQATKRMPGRPTYRKVVETIRKYKLTVKMLKPYWEAWNERGFRPENLAWLTEWAVSGEIPRAGGGKDVRAPAGGAPVKREIDQLLEAAEAEERKNGKQN